MFIVDEGYKSCSEKSSFVFLGDTVIRISPLFLLCYSCTENTLVLFWVNKDIIKTIDCKNEMLILFQYEFKSSGTKKVKICLETKTVNSNVTISRTYAYFVYISKKKIFFIQFLCQKCIKNDFADRNAKIEEKQVLCDDKGFKISSVLECTVTVEPRNEFQIDYFWTHMNSMSNLSGSNIFVTNPSLHFEYIS